jgi:glycerophosphoryl diester phosphodiesterase
MDSWRFLGTASPQQIAIVGHRGNPDRYPDNTLAGIMSGLAVTGAVEIDIRLSGDGRLGLSHDPFVGGMQIGETRWRDLADIDVGSGHRPCQLEDVLALEGCLDLEVKNSPFEEGFDPGGRLALLVASRARADDIVTGFYWPDMDLVRMRAPDVTTGLLVDRDGSALDALGHATERGHRAIVPHHTLIDRDLSSAAREEDVALVAWTVNEIDRALELSLIGVAAIISDHPALIKRALG